MKKYLIILFVLFSPFVILAQDCCWFGGKINTKLDSTIIIEQKIKTIKVYQQNLEKDSLPIKKLIKIIDVINCTSKWCDTLIGIKYKNNKIIEEFKFNYSSGWDYKLFNVGKYKLTHYLDKKGRVIKTQRKWIKGGALEDFDSITYEYNGNLLIKANYFSGMGFIISNEGEELPYKVLLYKYE